MNQPQPNIEVKPTRVAHFQAGNGSRELATLESFEVARLTLNDWFDLSKPAHYRVGLRFGADSGIGEAWPGEVYFEVVGGSD